MPWLNNQSRVVIGCSVRATWLSARIWHAGPAYAFYSENLNFGTFRDINVDRSWLDALRPKTPIAGPGHFDWGPNTLQTSTSLAEAAEPLFLESIISSHFVDGLARTGSHRAYNSIDSQSDNSPSEWPLWTYEKVPNYNSTRLRGGGALKRPTPGPKFTEVRMEMIIDGYAFRAYAISDYL
ncbi:MAG: hypothetical protein Q9217_002039 [Psora testacea]